MFTRTACALCNVVERRASGRAGPLYTACFPLHKVREARYSAWADIAVVSTRRLHVTMR